MRNKEGNLALYRCKPYSRAKFEGITTEIMSVISGRVYPDTETIF